MFQPVLDGDDLGEELGEDDLNPNVLEGDPIFLCIWIWLFKFFFPSATYLHSLHLSSMREWDAFSCLIRPKTLEKIAPQIVQRFSMGSIIYKGSQDTEVD